MSAALTRFDPPPADNQARHAGRSGGSPGRAFDRAGDGAGNDADWRGPEAIAAERARRAGGGEGRRETGAAGLDKAAALQDETAIAACMGDLTARTVTRAAGGTPVDDLQTSDLAAKAVTEALARLAPEGEADEVAQAQDPAARFFASLERLRALAGQLDGAGGVGAGAAQAGATGEPVRNTGGEGDQSLNRNAARMPPGAQAAHAAMESDDDLHLSLRDNAGRSGLGARQAAGIGEARVVSQATHFAPVSQAALGASNMDALAKAFDEGAAFMREAGQNTSGRGGETRGADMRAGGFDQTLAGSLRGEGTRPAGPVKTLTIQLTPVSQAALGASNMDALAKAFDEGAAFMREAGQNMSGRGGETRGAEMRAGGFEQTLAGSLRGEGTRPAGPVKTLTIQLTPVSLGKISVAMHLSDGAMRMEITVADPRALEMVRADKELIGNLIRKSGLSPESITIQSGDPTQAGRQNAGGNGAGQNGAAPGGQQQGEAGSHRGSRQGGEGGERPDHEGGIRHENAHGTRLSDGGDIYL